MLIRFEWGFSRVIGVFVAQPRPVQSSEGPALCPDTALRAVRGHIALQASGTHKRELGRREPKDKADISRFGGSEWLPDSRKPIRKGGGRSPPTFPDGFPGGRRQLRPTKSTHLGFYLSAPFGAAPTWVCGRYLGLQVHSRTPQVASVCLVQPLG